MGKIAPAQYVPAAAKAETSNQYDDLLKETFAAGVDTAFAVTFTNHDEYKVEKGQIQRASNRAGFTAREFDTDYDESKPGEVTSKFVLRAKYEGRGRKPNSAKTEKPADAPTPAEAPKSADAPKPDAPKAPTSGAGKR